MKHKKIFLVVLTTLIISMLLSIATFADEPLTEGGEIWYEYIPDTYDKDDIDFLTNSILVAFNDENTNKAYITYNGYKLNIINFEDPEVYMQDPYENGIYNAKLNDFYTRETTKIYINSYYYNYVEDLTGLDLNSYFKQLNYEDNSIIGVFMNIPSFLVQSFSGISSIFYSNGLTFIGTLTVCALAVAVILLIFNIIKNYVAFGG